MYEYEHDGTGWVATAVLDHGEGHGQFGSSIALSGGTAVFGAEYAFVTETFQGRTYVFVKCNR